MKPSIALALRLALAHVASAALCVGCAHDAQPPAESARTPAQSSTPAPTRAASEPSKPADSWRMIADFREDARSDVPSEHALEALIAKRIVTRVCKRPGGKSASDSAIRPIVCLAGAFSKASTTSTACIASFESCDVHFGPDATETRMIVFQEERVSLNVELEANGARAVGDVDGDGLDDLLLTSGGSGQGITTVHMSLASLAGGKVTTLHEFSLGEELSCGGFTPTPHDEAPVFSMRAQGSVPIFREELYARECEENAPWVLAKTQSP